MRQHILFKLCFALFSLCLAANAVAANRKFPHGCRAVGYQFMHAEVDLKPVSETPEIQTIYLIHNTSQQTVQLVPQKLAHHPVMPDYTKQINADEWMAFSQDEPLVKFVCQYVYEGGDTQNTSCNDVLELCQYPRAKFAQHNGGSYWVGPHSDTLKQTVRNVVENGVLLRW